jgi:hypothetical protein
MFVRRRLKPMKVKKIKAVRATPRSADDNGEEAAAGKDFQIQGVSL